MPKILTWAQVDEIRRLAPKVRCSVLAERFDVNKQTVYLIIRGINWKPRVRGRKLTVDQVREIRGLYCTDMSTREVASKYGVSKSLISFIWNGQRWNGCM